MLTKGLIATVAWLKSVPWLDLVGLRVGLVGFGLVGFGLVGVGFWVLACGSRLVSVGLWA